MKLMPLLRFAAFAGLIVGCERVPVAVPADSLTFPVILVTGTHESNVLPARADVIADQRELGRLPQETYARINDATLTDPPIVIDATAAAFDMIDIKGEHGGLWMMANPTSRMPIRFTLVRRDQAGLEAARAILKKCKYLGPDIDDERRVLRLNRIADAKSMAEIMEIIDEIPVSIMQPRPRPFEPQE